MIRGIARLWSSRLRVIGIVQPSAWPARTLKDIKEDPKVEIRECFVGGTEAQMGRSMEEWPFPTTESDLPWI